MNTTHTRGGRRTTVRRGSTVADGTAGGAIPASDLTRVGLTAGAGIVAAVAVAAYLRRPSAQASVATARRQALVTYLADHLRGADAAIQVVGRLSRSHAGTRDGRLFRELVDEFEEERAMVQSLVEHLGGGRTSRVRAAGSTTGALLQLAAGGEPGDLSLLVTLEALAIGIQGKRCMWRALHELGEPLSLGNHSFHAMEAQALRQWATVDERRRALAAMTFPPLGQRLDTASHDGDRGNHSR